MIRELVTRLGKRFRGEIFSIDPDLSLTAVAMFALTRAAATMRGLTMRPLLAPGSGLPLFIGPGTKLRTRNKIKLAKGATLGAGVTIQGLSRKGIHLHSGASIGAYSIIVATSVMRNLGEGFTMGENSGLGQFCFVGCGGGVMIGRNVIGGQYISFHSENHIYEDVDQPIRLQGVRRAQIVVEDDCWIGAKATFLSGCMVSRGCVIAAGAVVRGHIPPYSIIGGVPARILGSRKHGDPFPALVIDQQAFKKDTHGE